MENRSASLAELTQACRGGQGEGPARHELRHQPKRCRPGCDVQEKRKKRDGISAPRKEKRGSGRWWFFLAFATRPVPPPFHPMGTTSGKCAKRRSTPLVCKTETKLTVFVFFLGGGGFVVFVEMRPACEGLGLKSQTHQLKGRGFPLQRGMA